VCSTKPPQPSKSSCLSDSPYLLVFSQPPCLSVSPLKSRLFLLKKSWSSAPRNIHQPCTGPGSPALNPRLPDPPFSCLLTLKHRCSSSRRPFSTLVPPFSPTLLNTLPSSWRPFDSLGSSACCEDLALPRSLLILLVRFIHTAILLLPQYNA
jgi:hypothetical protein